MATLADKNRRIGLMAAGTVVAMISLSYISVPLYNLFCRVTGFDGTTMRVAENPNTVPLAREMVVRFDTNTDAHLPWEFLAEQKPVNIRVGQTALVSFSAENLSSEPVAGTALFNVTPEKAGQYFNKIQCFCFGEQILQPGEKVHMPVSFFIDPEIANDKNLDDVKTITLSYSFFKKDSAELELAKEKFYNTAGQTP